MTFVDFGDFTLLLKWLHQKLPCLYCTTLSEFTLVTGWLELLNRARLDISDVLFP